MILLPSLIPRGKIACRGDIFIENLLDKLFSIFPRFFIPVNTTGEKSRTGVPFLSRISSIGFSRYFPVSLSSHVLVSLSSHVRNCDFKREKKRTLLMSRVTYPREPCCGYATLLSNSHQCFSSSYTSKLDRSRIHDVPNCRLEKWSLHYYYSRRSKLNNISRLVKIPFHTVAIVSTHKLNPVFCTYRIGTRYEHSYWIKQYNCIYLEMSTNITPMLSMQLFVYLDEWKLSLWRNPLSIPG